MNPNLFSFSSRVMSLDSRCFARDSISALDSVVSEGSPGSSLAVSLSTDDASRSPLVARRVRGRFDGGTVLFDSFPIGATFFFCFPTGVSRAEADSSPSSPDASRDDGCGRSTAAARDLAPWVSSCDELRFRFPALLDGEDMVGDQIVFSWIKRDAQSAEFVVAF